MAPVTPKRVRILVTRAEHVGTFDAHIVGALTGLIVHSTYRHNSQELAADVAKKWCTRYNWAVVSVQFDNGSSDS